MQIIMMLAFNISFLNPVARTIDNFRMTDVFYEISNAGAERDTSGLITIVDMTTEFDRGRLAEIVDEIQSYEPSVMGIDIVFDGVRNDSVGNERLIESVCSTVSPTVWAYKLTHWNSDEGQFDRSYHSFFTEVVDVEREGFINVQRDINGGTIRTLGLHRETAEGTEYSLTAQVALAATNDSSIITKSKDCNVCYTSTYFPVVPADSIAAYADLIRSHIVLLGAMHDIRDQHYTPIGKIPGVEILAYAIQTLVLRRMPIEFPLWMSVLLIFLIIWFTQLIQQGVTNSLQQSSSSMRRYLGNSGLAASVISMIAMVLLVGACFVFFFHWNIYFNTVWAIMGIALLDNAREIYELIIRIISNKWSWKWVTSSMYYAETE